MKKVTLLLAVLVFGGLMLTGCKKDKEQQQQQEPTKPTTYTVAYKVLKEDLYKRKLSDCFKIDVTYNGADGKPVTLKDQKLPWIMSFEVEAPFHAEMSGTFTYKEEELPDSVVFGQRFGIIIQNDYYLDGSVNGGFGDYTKEKFLTVYGGDENAHKLKFTASKDLKLN